MSRASKYLIGALAVSASGSPFGLPGSVAYASLAPPNSTMDSSAAVKAQLTDRVDLTLPSEGQKTRIPQGRQFAQPNNAASPPSPP
jgi:hypothetical protein